MGIDFGQLKTLVARADSSAQMGLAAGGVATVTASKGWLGKQVAWLRGDSQTPQQAQQNKDVRIAVHICLATTFGIDYAMDASDVHAVMSKVDWDSSEPLSARQVSTLIDELHTRRAGAYVDQNLQGRTTVLGSGAANTVHLGNWAMEGQASQKMVFKAEPEPGTPLQLEAAEIGIPAAIPNLAARNVATYQLNQALQLDVIPATQFACHQKQGGSVMALAPGASVQGDGPVLLHTGVSKHAVQQHRGALDRLLGPQGIQIKAVSQDGTLVLQRTPPSEQVKAALILRYDLLDPKGAPMSEAQVRALAAQGNDFSATQCVEKINNLGKLIASADVHDAGLRSSMNQLQWLDSLCGQADRHPGNIFIERDAQGQVCGVKGIDNDMSFGIHSDTLYANPAAAERGRAQAKYPAVPRVIDKALCDRLLAMAALPRHAAGSIEAVLEGKLQPAEIAMARQRLSELADKLQSTDPVIRRIENPQDWSGPDVAALLDVGPEPVPARADGANGSYLAACQANQQGLTGRNDSPLLVDVEALQQSILPLLQP